MATLNKRMTALEVKLSISDHDEMTNSELDAYLAALNAGSHEWFRALLSNIWRRGSRLPLAPSDKSR